MKTFKIGKVEINVQDFKENKPSKADFVKQYKDAPFPRELGPEGVYKKLEQLTGIATKSKE